MFTPTSVIHSTWVHSKASHCSRAQLNSNGRQSAKYNNDLRNIEKTMARSSKLYVLYDAQAVELFQCHQLLPASRSQPKKDRGTGVGLYHHFVRTDDKLWYIEYYIALAIP